MSVSNQETAYYYVGNGVTVTFAFNCQVPSANDLAIYINDVLTTSGFTISGIGNPTGGAVTFSVAPSNQATVRIERIIALERSTDYQQNGDFLARVVNLDFNRIWMALQQQASSLKRAVLVPKSDNATPAELPRAKDRANKLLGFDANGQPTAYIPESASLASIFLMFAAAAGSSLIGFHQSGVGAVVRNLLDKARETVSVTDFGADPTGVRDSTAAIQAAINKGINGNLEVLFPSGTYIINDSLDARNKGGLILRGQGLPIISSGAVNKPILLIGGERNLVTGLMFQYGYAPTSAQTDCVAIRCYNLYESIIDRVYIYRVYNGIDQFQGAVNGNQNAFYSNMVSNIRIIYFSGWAINLKPYLGGNSGNRLDNIYINNRSGNLASDSLPCIGGLYLQTAEDGVYNQVNIEWMRNAGPAIVLNQCANPVFNGLHFEGLYPTTNFNPVIDIPGGDNSMPMFNGLSVVSCDWGGGVGMGLFRMDNQGTKLYVNGLRTKSNTNLGGMAGLLINGGATCYGSFIEVINAACDGGFQAGESNPKISAGAVVAGVAYPLIRYNDFRPGYSASVVSNDGGNQTTGVMSGTASTDLKAMWSPSDTRFNIKKGGNYAIAVSIPTGASPIIQVQKNYTTIATLALAAGGGTASLILPLQENDNILFYLASGSYTRTGVNFGVGRLG